MTKTDSSPDLHPVTDPEPKRKTPLTSRANPPVIWAVVQLIALSFHVPLGLLTGSQRALSSSSSVYVVGLALSALAIAVYFVLGRFVGGWKALGLTSAAVLLFWHSSGFDSILPLPDWLATSLLVVLVLAATAKYSEARLFKLGMFIGSLTLGATMVFLVATDTVNTPSPIVEIKDPVGEISLNQTPDIVVVMLDGYGRSDVLERNFGYDNTEFLDGLSARGFDVSESASSNYTITHFSLPSLMNMSYLNEPYDFTSNSDLEALAAMASGDNEVVHTLKDAGYRYVHGDSDHWFNTCGPLVDVCLPGPVLDVTGHALLSTTVLKPFLYPSSGDPTTSLNLARIDQLTNWSEQNFTGQEQPTFAFLHLVIPHAPMFLDRNCNVRVDGDLGGRILNDGDIGAEHLAKRKAAWVEQTECANQTIMEFLDEIDDDAIVAVISDHGPDSEFLLTTADPNDVTAEQLNERLPNLAAVRLPSDCRGTLPEDVHSVNLFRVVFSCISDEQIPLLPADYYVTTFGGSIVPLDHTNPINDR